MPRFNQRELYSESIFNTVPNCLVVPLGVVKIAGDSDSFVVDAVEEQSSAKYQQTLLKRMLDLALTFKPRL